MNRTERKTSSSGAIAEAPVSILKVEKEDIIENSSNKTATADEITPLHAITSTTTGPADVDMIRRFVYRYGS